MDNELAQGGNVIPFPSRFEREFVAVLKAHGIDPDALREETWQCIRGIDWRATAEKPAQAEPAPTPLSESDHALREVALAGDLLDHILARERRTLRPRAVRRVLADSLPAMCAEAKDPTIERLKTLRQLHEQLGWLIGREEKKLARKRTGKRGA